MVTVVRIVAPAMASKMAHCSITSDARTVGGPPLSYRRGDRTQGAKAICAAALAPAPAEELANVSRGVLHVCAGANRTFGSSTSSNPSRL
jgi:hypothetical protein